MPTERKHREEIVRYGKMLHERGFVAAMDGNLSVRLKRDRILVTPTGLSKGAMKSADIVIVNLEGERVSGHRRQSCMRIRRRLPGSRPPELR